MEPINFNPSRDEIQAILSRNFIEKKGHQCQLAKLIDCEKCPFIHEDKQHCDLAIIYLAGRK
jgi:hypothetical protein